MTCLEEHKVGYAIYMLSSEVENWWKFTKLSMPTVRGITLWDSFKQKFLDNYFSRDLHKQKTREFLDLKQGSMSVGEYVTKFNELV